MVQPRTLQQFDLASASNSQVNHVPIVHATPPIYTSPIFFFNQIGDFPRPQGTGKSAMGSMMGRQRFASEIQQSPVVNNHRGVGFADGAQQFCPDTADTASLASS